MTEDSHHPLGRALCAALLVLSLSSVSSFVAAQEKLPPPPPGQAVESENPRAPGVRGSGYLLYGDPAPNFSLPGIIGGPIQLREYKNHASVVVVFTERADFDIGAYSPAADSLRDIGAWIVFVTHQRPNPATRQASREPERVRLAYDRLGEVARTYGAMDVVTEDLIPSMFLIDPRGIVRYIAVGALPAPETLAATIRGVLLPESTP